MKILLLAEACGAGVGRHVIDLASGLAELSHEIHLVYSPLRADRAFVNGFNRLRAAYPHIRHQVLPIRRHPHASDFSVAWRLRRYVASTGPFDVIHAHSTKAGLLARLALAGLPGARLYTPHAPITMNPGLKGWARCLLGCYELFLSCFTRYIIAVSPEELTHLQSMGVSPDKMRLVPNGVDLDNWGPRNEGPPSGSPLCIGFLGRLAPQKDLPTLLAAFAQVLRTAGRPVLLTIGGDGAIRAELQNLCRKLGIAAHVRWLGECDAHILASFDVFALSSRYEGLPYTLLESMAAGVPAVSTRVGGVSLLVSEGVTGFTVPVGDVDAFASALAQLVADPGMRRRMGNAARERVAAFSVHAMVRSTLAVYHQAVISHVPLKSVHEKAEQAGIWRQPLN